MLLVFGVQVMLWDLDLGRFVYLQKELKKIEIKIKLKSQMYKKMIRENFLPIKTFPLFHF